MTEPVMVPIAAIYWTVAVWSFLGMVVGYRLGFDHAEKKRRGRLKHVALHPPKEPFRSIEAIEAERLLRQAGCVREVGD